MQTIFEPPLEMENSVCPNVVRKGVGKPYHLYSLSSEVQMKEKQYLVLFETNERRILLHLPGYFVNEYWAIDVERIFLLCSATF